MRTEEIASEGEENQQDNDEASIEPESAHKSDGRSKKEQQKAIDRYKKYIFNLKDA